MAAVNPRPQIEVITLPAEPVDTSPQRDGAVDVTGQNNISALINASAIGNAPR